MLVIDAEFKALIPALSEEEYAGLEANILADGCRDAIVIWNDVIIDGHNRFEICSRHNIPFQQVEREFDSREDAVIWIVRNQFGRRNISSFVRGELALRLKAAFKEKGKENQRGGQGGVLLLANLPKAIDTREELAKMADVSARNIDKVESVLASAPEQIQTAARSGDISIDRAYKVTKALEKASPEVREICIQHGTTDAQVVALCESKKNTDTVKTLLTTGYSPGGIAMAELTAWDLQGDLRASEKEHRAAANDQRIQGKLSNIQALPPQTFSVIYADPPWRYDNSGLHGAAERHCPTMAIEDIESLLERIDLCIAPDAVLFLWATNPLLPEALRVIQGWNFDYKTNFVWLKDKATTGLGFYTHGKHELLMLATRGNFQPNFRPESILDFAKGRHSEKPESVYPLIETMYPNQTYVELFAREAAERDRWTFWGAEVNAED